ncbi:MAG: HAD-IG family 5'-nucleotidase, partial [Myxococcales bacterium]|nr:HAD-IG family 5'-nucleotidase [Myxococcales bacterium]
GYPEFLLTMDYRTDFPVRGLLVDKKYGHVLKMDRYKYVKKAYHGLRPLDLEERRKLYHSKRLRPETKRYHWVDTLYALSEVAVYAATIDAMEAQGKPVDYGKLFADVRECIDLSHQDGSILDVVLADMPQYIHRDERLPQTLHKLRSAGKRLFVLTNSRAAYTEKIMSYLLDGALPGYTHWKHYFDVVITASKKPRFFDRREPFVEILGDGSEVPAKALERGRVYAGGNLRDFEKIVGVPADRILYVGDHIFGDVLRAKKETAWRTAMILQEMDQEMEAYLRSAGDHNHLDSLTETRVAHYQELQAQQSHLKEITKKVDAYKLEGKRIPTDLDGDRVVTRKNVERLRTQVKILEEEINALEDRIDEAFHPFWGSLLKAGPEKSSFGNQVETYACLYTDRVSNFFEYSPHHYFRSPRDRMPHEF